MATANMDRMDPAAELLSVTKAGATQSGPAQTATGITEAAGKDQAAPKHPDLQHLSVEQPSQPNSSRAEGAASECEKGSSSQGQAATGGAQDQPARIQLAVADWSPFGCGSGSLPEPEPEPELDAGVQDQPVRGRVPHADWRQPQGGQQWASSAGGSTTESDSGKDAAEVFVSRGARLSQGKPDHLSFGSSGHQSTLAVPVYSGDCETCTTGFCRIQVQAAGKVTNEEAAGKVTSGNGGWLAQKAQSQDQRGRVRIQRRV